jgi:polyisoprenyl-teichoic acid--peptidoglycan teichoic acid transferase
VQRFRIPLLAMLLILLIAALNIDKVLPLSVREILNKGEPINILLLGIDARPDEVNARSDTIILASFNHDLNKVALVWIPRDTRIASPHKSQKINMVNQMQGPEATCKEVSKILNTSVNYYVLTNFAGFEKIIDILGGVYMDVDINLSSPASGVYLTKGYQRLNGKEALKYARYRGRTDGDIGRTERQQKLVSAIAKQVMQAQTIEKIPELLSALRRNVQTNLSFTDMLYLADVYAALDDNSIITQTLPGRAYNDPYSGASYWEVDRQISRSILESLFHGHKYGIDLDDLPETQ